MEKLGEKSLLLLPLAYSHVALDRHEVRDLYMTGRSLREMQYERMIPNAFLIPFLSNIPFLGGYPGVAGGNIGVITCGGCFATLNLQLLTAPCKQFSRRFIILILILDFSCYPDLCFNIKLA